MPNGRFASMPSGLIRGDPHRRCIRSRKRAAKPRRCWVLHVTQPTRREFKQGKS
jgi:hypothetical protein